jgi:hydrogenase expression/formation protein HypE
MSDIQMQGFSCPLPIMKYDTIQLAHGAGGKLSADLIDQVFLPCFDNPTLAELSDSAVLPAIDGLPVLSTDSFVVNPIFFPGGDIGDLAVNGTVNDVALSGAKPLYLTVGFILEEGLPIADLHAICVSMRRAADKAGVSIISGDTKVVDKGAADKLFINTTGFGVRPPDRQLSAKNIKPGDKIILSGSVADHGMAVLTKREALSFSSDISSDTAALNDLIRTMLASTTQLRCMRDPTRGGVATTLNELAAAAGVKMRIVQTEVPLQKNVAGACEILGIDPLYVANEGKLIAIVAADAAPALLLAMQQHPLGTRAAVIGEVVASEQSEVTIITPLGVERILEMPIAEQLPRIC